MDAQLQIFIVLMVVGLFLVGAEVFIPGGILGTIGGFALLGAVIAAFARFGPVIGGYVAGIIILLVGVVIGLWIKFFPRTWLGKRMTVSRDLHESKGTETGIESLMGAEGIATSELRPAGYADIAGRRVDVVTEGEMIQKGKRIHVVHVEGNRVVVDEVKE